MKFCKFNDNTIVTEFIKELLSSTYIPMCKVWKPGDTVVKNQVYVTQNHILTTVKTFEDENGEKQEALNFATPSNEYDTKVFKILDTYIFGERYKGITSNYVSNNFLYDSNTHYQLGKYLYFLRDLKGLNLFPYYNMWCNEIDETRHLEKVDENFKLVKNGKYVTSKLLYVPVRLGETYTIYLNSPIPVPYAITYIDNRKQLTQTNLSSGSLSVCRFNQPQTITVPNIKDSNASNTDALSNYEEYLTLVLQVPNGFNGNLIVLNGDYIKASKFNERAQLNIENKNNQADITINTIPSLSLLADNNRYAFSYRLVEYLVHNVICDIDEIENNIERVQKEISTRDYTIDDGTDDGTKTTFQNTYIKGIWDKNMTGFISTIIANSKKNYLVYDQDGYVNVEVEKLLKEGV